MIDGLIGKKLGMTQVYDGAGKLVPVTVIEAGPCRVTQIKSKDRNGYDAVQVGFGDIADKKLTRPQKGHFKSKEVAPSRWLREFSHVGDVQIGQLVKADLFHKGDFVDVQGISKGKGFQGVIKRHHYGGGPESHGSMFHRAPGSIGSSSYPSRVWKNKALPGHMGNKQVTVQRLRVIEARPEENLLFIEGAVPGARDGLVTVRKTSKGK